MNKKSKIILLILIVGFLFSLPIVPVNVVPEVSIKAIDINQKPISGITIYQDWQHWTFESENHRDEAVSDENGFAVFSTKKIWISTFNFLFNTIAENTIGLIAIHASSGPTVGFGAAGYKTENKWCFPDRICKDRESAKEIIILEKYEQ